MTKDFLFELGTEELPAKGLWTLAKKIADEYVNGLKNAALHFSDYHVFVTPRRLAILVKNLDEVQPDRTIEKRGPVVNAPKAAIEGFARSCQTTVDQLVQEKQYWFYRYVSTGQTVDVLLPIVLKQTIDKLSGVKWMRWGNQSASFLRPVQWMIMLYGDRYIHTALFNKKTVTHTFGHRFHAPQALPLLNAAQYKSILLQEGFVQVDFKERQQTIYEQIKNLAKTKNAQPLIGPQLLEEVTGLVEWPVALICQFDERFLKVPQEALISSMQYHQKCFPLLDEQNRLLPFFITISNIESRDPAQVIQGNERVMRARLSDAAFFYEQDVKENFADRASQLSNIMFHEKLGSVLEKTQRITLLAKRIASMVQADAALAQRAAVLAKCDLTTQMVNEFPELQGVMGAYYAKAQGEDPDVAAAIGEHYLPRFAGDALPKTTLGCVLALADRIDTLISIFSVGQAPTGDKDPFALRRAASGIVRILIERQIEKFHLSACITQENVREFIIERLPAYYEEKNIAPEIVQAVLEVARDNLYDIHCRIMAVHEFLMLPEAFALIETNKRVKNILRKNEVYQGNIDPDKLVAPAEKNLYQFIIENQKSEPYQKTLENLAVLKTSIDQFFNDVMVDVPDEVLKQNRLQLLQALRNLFLRVADISFLQKSV